MDDPLEIAEAVRQACLAAVLRAYEDAGLSGLCHEGRWEYAIDTLRALPLRPLLQTLLEAQRGAEDGGSTGGTRQVPGAPV